MKKLVAIALLILASFLTSPFSTHPAHGLLTGVVCLTRASSSSCPQVPLTFNATTVGSSFTIGVFVSNSEAMGGFDIYVSVDPTYLNPTGAALGTLIFNPSLTSICINGVSVTGACTVNSANGPGVVEVTTAEGSGGNECGGIAPCSGMAFTITYRVVGSTPSTPISYPVDDNPFCAQSSVSNPPNVCVQVTEGTTGTILPETTLAGDFTDQNPTANFGANPTSGLAPLTVSFDASLSNATSGQTITKYNWDFGDGSPAANITTATTSHIYNSPGTYHPNLEVVDSSNTKSSIKDSLTISVIGPDFTISANTTSLPIQPGKNKNASIILTSTNGFGGTISLSANSSATLGIISTLNKTSVTLSSGQTDSTAKLTVAAAASTPSGTFTVNVTGTSGTLKHSFFITILVIRPDFQISASPQSLSIPERGNSNTIITVASEGGFSGNIALTAAPNSTSIVAFLNRTNVRVNAAGSNSSTLYIIAQANAVPGPYKVTVTGTSGSLIHGFNVTITVPPPDFSSSAAPTSLSFKVGAEGVSAVTFTSLNGFSGTITLTANSSTTLGISTSFSPQSVTINATSGPLTSALTISTLGTTPAGSYGINVTGSSGTFNHSVIITLTVTLSIPSGVQLGAASLSTVSATAGQSVSMIVSLTNTGSIPANLTVTMDVNSGTGENITVAQQTITLNPSQTAQTVTLSWNTTQWDAGNYHVYARIIGSQTNTINQAQSASTVALTAPPTSPGPGDLSVIPWITTATLAAIAAVLGLLLIRRRRPTGLAGSL